MNPQARAVASPSRRLWDGAMRDRSIFSRTPSSERASPISCRSKFAVGGSPRRDKALRRYCALGLIDEAIERARLGRRAAPLAQGLDPQRHQSFAHSDDEAIAGAHAAARLVEREPRAAAREAHAALLHHAGGKTAGLEEARAPQPDVDPASLARFA